jgi:hypothetical protein
MSYTPNKPYRIVFDIEIPADGPGFAYPSVLLLDSIEGILLDVDTPSLDLFKAISLMAINSIREECFDVVLETAIASMCAAVVFKELYPSFNPFEFPDLAVPDLFQELWKIHSDCDANLIPHGLRKFQDPSYPIPEDQQDVLVSFVTELCRLAKRNFIPFFRKALPEGFAEPADIAPLRAYSG